MDTIGRQGLVKVEIDLTPNEAIALKDEINSISTLTTLTTNDLNEKYPVTSRLLSDLDRVTSPSQ